MEKEDMLKLFGGLGIVAALLWLIVWLIKKD